MMEGDDNEKRQGFVQMVKLPTKKELASARPKSVSADDPMLSTQRDQEDQARADAEKERKLNISNKHYRKFYNDELEHNSDLFGEKVFTSVDIVRGQSRGLKKSWWNVFSAQQTDESGESSDKKKVGYFKGRISVFNEED